MPKRILVVDDDPTILTLAREKLTQGGFDVETAPNGEVAMNIVKRSDIDVIVTDIQMPQMDGVDFFKELKKHEKTVNTPVIVITENPRYKELFEKLGVHSFLEKPLEADVLLKEVNNVLGKNYKGSTFLVVGSDQEVTKDMAIILEKSGYQVGVAEDGASFMAKALTIQPDVVFLDILLKDVPAREMIRAMQQFMSLKDTTIITYTHFDPQKLSDVEAIEQIKQQKQACDEAGATKYIGRFSRSTFLESIRPFLQN